MTTPNTINTIDDICQLLDANPEMAAALNQRLRGPDQAAIQEQLNQAIALAAATAQTTAENSRHIAELRQTTAENSRLIAELGVKVDRLTETTAENSRLIQEIGVKQDRNAQQIAENSKQIAANVQTTAENSRLIAELGVKVDRLMETTAANSKQIAANSQKIAELGDKVDLNTANIANLVILSQNNAARMSRGENDAAELKNIATELRANRAAARIADKLNWEDATPLTPGILRRMVQNLDLTPGDRESFIDPDLIFQSEDQQGATVYCAVEISWTINQYDIDRAQRNADLLRQATGCTAEAAVYGERHEWDLNWGSVHWIPQRKLPPTP